MCKPQGKPYLAHSPKYFDLNCLFFQFLVRRPNFLQRWAIHWSVSEHQQCRTTFNVFLDQGQRPWNFPAKTVSVAPLPKQKVPFEKIILQTIHNVDPGDKTVPMHSKQTTLLSGYEPCQFDKTLSSNKLTLEDTDSVCVCVLFVFSATGKSRRPKKKKKNRLNFEVFDASLSLWPILVKANLHQVNHTEEHKSQWPPKIVFCFLYIGTANNDHSNDQLLLCILPGTRSRDDFVFAGNLQLCNCYCVKVNKYQESIWEEKHKTCRGVITLFSECPASLKSHA